MDCVFVKVGKMGLGSIALSLPFSCVLGVLSSMTSSAMGKLSTSVHTNKNGFKNCLKMYTTVPRARLSVG